MGGGGPALALSSQRGFQGCLFFSFLQTNFSGLDYYYWTGFGDGLECLGSPPRSAAMGLDWHGQWAYGSMAGQGRQGIACDMM